MKKLLHERLREFASILDDDDYTFRFEDGNFTDLELNEAESLADEIEKYYIPKPQFEDGEPVQFGDEFLDGVGGIHVLHEICFRDDVACGNGAPIVLKATSNHGKYDGISMNVWNKVKRHPKILDADGVELHVGETPYYVSGGKAGQIVSLHKAGTKHPISNAALPRDYVLYEGYGWDYADTLTHREPDSLAKLLDDIDRNSSSLEDMTNDDLQVIIRNIRNRLTAIMESDA